MIQYLNLHGNIFIRGLKANMTKQEMKTYLMSTGLYENMDTDMFYEDRMMDSNKTVPIKDLVERFIDIDKEFNGRPWNIMQILTNINMIIPVEDRGIIEQL